MADEDHVKKMRQQQYRKNPLEWEERKGKFHSHTATEVNKISEYDLWTWWENFMCLFDD